MESMLLRSVVCVILTLAVSVNAYGCLTETEVEIRTYQYKFNTSLFPPSSPVPPEAQNLVVTYVIKGTFQPKSFATFSASSWLEPFASTLCGGPTLIYALQNAESSFSSNYVFSGTEVHPIANRVGPFVNITATLVNAIQYDPEADTFQYIVANSRIFEDEPTLPMAEELNAAALANGVFMSRINNYDECPEVWGI